MVKPGRNDPCPCGSGKKYKKCCLAKEEAAEREQLAEAEARRAESAAAHRLHLQEMRAAMATLSYAEDADEDELTIASNAAADLVRAGKLEEAEKAANDLLVQFPEVHDGYDRLGMVHEARGDIIQAAECYRKVIAFIKEHPDDYEPGFEDTFVTLVNRLDPPAET
jgi:tetratricopeptide (TPR) repeat protein